MHILKDGRVPYLEFLRNLTPQTVVLSFALVAGDRLQPTCCHPENMKETLIFLCFLTIWGLAAWANSSTFIEKYLVATERINRASRLLIRSGTKGWRNMYALLFFAWRNERAVFWEVIIVFVVVEFGLVVVVMSAIGSASSFIKLLHG